MGDREALRGCRRTKMASIGSVLTSLCEEYKKRTPQKLKIIDVFLTYIVLTGFIPTIGSFVLTVSLRMQVNPANKFSGISEERAFADFLLCNFILHLVVANFMG